MEMFDYILNMVDAALDSERRRHLIGGALMSLSLLFGGLAVTTLTTKEDKSNEHKKDNVNSSSRWDRFRSGDVDIRSSYEDIDLDEEGAYGEL